ncbi:DNA-binding transcriptional ArsR family regulator [Pseudonocardia sediminis]|uniref:DNA-binding transcriptional ArsR family regulator n=1 Tax=Pseudonocardia sediminis TaxID=1397368 RepID=A0A4Q7UY34_PSEST|nr:winged helix-turn-helix domain-containing protein [Pseudonocardia sediminis]RZT87007.1 DNA-binding transcriptional ArsR family regulator [Pseudonocardia sediminis]
MVEHAPSTDPATDSRLEELERRLRDVERALGGGAPDPGPVRAEGDPGTVHYGGDVHLYGDISWQCTYDAGATLDLDDDPRTSVLSALGHPVRVRIVRSLLRGPRGTAELGEAAELASTGQLYHHLRALTHCGLVEQDGRGSYRIAPRTVVPALVLLTAAADIAGQLGAG